VPFTYAAWLVDSAATEYDTGLFGLLFGCAVIPAVKVYINPRVYVELFGCQ